jgi:hypothetical protein
MFRSGGGLDDRWASFRKRYGDGFVVLSRVGFNQARDHALLGVSTSCGSVCGSGQYMLLTKGNGRWQITEQHRTWVS